DPEAMPEMEARPRVKNRHGGAPRGERPALWDARRSQAPGARPNGCRRQYLFERSPIAGCDPLFPDCYLQWMAQLQRIEPSARRWPTFRIPRAVLAYARSSVTARARIQRPRQPNLRHQPLARFGQRSHAARRRLQFAQAPARTESE